MNNNNYNSESVTRNEEHIRKTYFDKACKLLKISMVLAILVFIDYLLNMGELVFFGIIKRLVGIFFYTASSIIILLSSIFAFITRESLDFNKIERAKKFIIFAVISAFVSSLFIAFFCIINPDIINLRSILIANGNYKVESALNESGIGIFNGTEIACYASIIASAVTCLTITVLQYKAINSILKADGTVKSTDFAENFYDKL